MIQVLVHHEVNDYRSWRSVFDAAIDFRHLGGERSCRVFRNSGDPHAVVGVGRPRAGAALYEFSGTTGQDERGRRDRDARD